MISIAHLIDDMALGGVTRTLSDQTERLQRDFRITQTTVSPRRPLPPRVAEDVAVIHYTASWSKLPFLTLLRTQRGDNPIVLVEHTYTRAFERCCVPTPARFRRMLALTYRLVDKVVAVSDGQAQWLLETGVVPREKLTVIRPSVNYTPLLNVAPVERDPAAPLRLAAYGRYSEQKGFDILIAAMKLLPKELATLTLAGYGSDHDQLERTAAGLANVHVGGRVDQLGRFLSACDAVVIPSRWEAFGNVCVEARAAARPVLVSDVDGLSEQVSPGYGVLVDAVTPARLADAIRELASRDLTAMGQEGRLSARSHQGEHFARWRALLDSLCPAKVQSASAA